MTVMEEDVALFFRDQLRGARAAILKDSEAFYAVVHVLERIGRLLEPRKVNGLGAYQEVLVGIASHSPLAASVPKEHPEYHLPFENLFGMLVERRNSAVHEGALARQLASNALAVALILEDALMKSARTAGDFMVRNPIVALPWQPLSMVRQATPWDTQRFQGQMTRKARFTMSAAHIYM